MITGIPRINSIENICSNFKRHLYIVIYNKKWVNAKKQHLVLVSTAIKHVYEIMGDEKSNRVHPKIRKNLHISYDNFVVKDSFQLIYEAAILPAAPNLDCLEYHLL